MKSVELGDFARDLLHTKFTKGDLGESSKGKEMVEFHCKYQSDHWQIDWNKACAVFRRNPKCPDCAVVGMKKMDNLVATMVKYIRGSCGEHLKAGSGGQYSISEIFSCPSCDQRRTFTRPR